MNLTELRRLHEAATGEWELWIDPAVDTFEGYEPAELRGIRTKGEHNTVVRFDDDYGTDQGADAELIVAMRNALPALLDCVEALEKIRDGRVLSPRDIARMTAADYIDEIETFSRAALANLKGTEE